MAFKDELDGSVNEYVQESWGEIPEARVIPLESDLSYGNSAKSLDVTVLYADISKSTQMVQTMLYTKVAEYYKAFLYCASKIISRNSGDIQAYDGDRVMAIYVGDDQADQAVRTAFEINYAVSHIINPKFQSFYSNEPRLAYTVGIDSGRCLAVKVGVRNTGELTWVGSAANIAAKLNSFDGLDHDYPTRITNNTLIKLSPNLLVDRSGSNLWFGPYNNFSPLDHYRSKGYCEF